MYHPAGRDSVKADVINAKAGSDAETEGFTPGKMLKIDYIPETGAGGMASRMMGNVYHFHIVLSSQQFQIKIFYNFPRKDKCCQQKANARFYSLDTFSRRLIQVTLIYRVTENGFENSGVYRLKISRIWYQE